MKRRKIYLKRYEIEEAREIIFKTLKDLGFFRNFPSEVVDTRKSLWRTTKNSVYAKKSVPEINISAMDGIATRSLLTKNASEANPIYLQKEDFIYINTGNPVPDRFDCVVKIEDVWESEKGLEIRKPVRPFENIRLVGEDLLEGDLILEQRRLITPEAVTLFISTEVREIEVLKRIKITIIPTGNEIVKPFNPRKETEIYESNSFIYKGYLEKIGVVTKILSPIPDEEEKISTALMEAVKNSDMVIISAGTSAGEYDYTAKILESRGKLLIHGVDLRPGKPFVFGVINAKPIFGLPGYPGAAINDFKLFVYPVIEKLYGINHERGKIKVRLARKLPSSVGEDHLISLSIGKVGNGYRAIPLKSGSGIVSSFLKRNGFVNIKKGIEGIEEGEEVLAVREYPLDIIDKTILFTGSHDLLLDVLKILLWDEEIPLSISSIGSLGGMIAVKKGHVHLAGSHLIDPESGDYNIPYIKKLDIKDIVVLHLAKREQGIMVPKNNPKNIKDIKDLSRKDIRFINRQKGSGTRMLFDLLIEKEGLSPEKIRGYDREVITHTEVGLQIKNGHADCGLGIYSVAKIFNLDFIPLAHEEYDLIVRKDFVQDKRFDVLMKKIQSEEFKTRALELGGYDISKTGIIKYEG